MHRRYFILKYVGKWTKCTLDHLKLIDYYYDLHLPSTLPSSLAVSTIPRTSPARE
ncbi:MAG: hypothetical protein S4CHLAM37_04470 [Chlamydiia bacterium]|nr:hypothetical protein [Chlamydiia bacterium]